MAGWREAPELAEARMVCCARHTPAPTDETATRAALLRSRHLRDDRVRHLAHTEPAVHRRLLDPAERVGLGELEPGHEDALGPVDRLARLQPLAQVGDLGL